jgi:hypothetical protein
MTTDRGTGKSSARNRNRDRSSPAHVVAVAGLRCRRGNVVQNLQPLPTITHSGLKPLSPDLRHRRVPAKSVSGWSGRVRGRHGLQ